MSGNTSFLELATNVLFSGRCSGQLAVVRICSHPSLGIAAQSNGSLLHGREGENTSLTKSTVDDIANY